MVQHGTWLRPYVVNFVEDAMHECLYYQDTGDNDDYVDDLRKWYQKLGTEGYPEHELHADGDHPRRCYHLDCACPYVPDQPP